MKLIPSIAILLCATFGTVAIAQTAPADSRVAASESTDAHWQLQLSPYAYHFHNSSEHKPVYLIGIERESKGGYLGANSSIMGAAYFSNSFGQPSGFIYPVGGVYNDVAGVQGLFAKWMAGVMYGYVGQYKDKVPFNYKGFNPVIAPSIGYQLTKNVGAQIDFLGTAGVMFQLNIKLK